MRIPRIGATGVGGAAPGARCRGWCSCGLFGLGRQKRTAGRARESGADQTQSNEQGVCFFTHSHTLTRTQNRYLIDRYFVVGLRFMLCEFWSAWNTVWIMCAARKGLVHNCDQFEMNGGFAQIYWWNSTLNRIYQDNINDFKHISYLY